MTYWNGTALKTALVLSAGGMFGAYQAGAWRAMEETFHPDIVVGASAGSLNSWAIAGGATADDLERIWLDPAGVKLARFRLVQAPWRGVFDSRPLYTHIENLWHRYRPRVEIGVVAVDLLTLTARLFRNEEIGWKHLAASCAVLTCYPQVRLGERVYTDGGLLDRLPLWAAAEMGAERIVAVDVLPEAPSRVVRAAVSAFRAVAPAAPGAPADIPVRMLSAGARLGRLREALLWRESSIRRFIERGEADARRAAREAGPWP